MLQGLRLLEPVVFYAKVRRAGGRACCQQAQLQHVLELAGARGDGVFLGHADLIGHSWVSLPGCRTAGSLTLAGVPAHSPVLGLRQRYRRPAQRRGGGRRSGVAEAAAHLGRIPTSKARP